MFLQFIGGIGIPVEDLSFESVTSGYVLKAEYFLPETAHVFRQKIKPQTIHRRSINNTMTYLANNYDEASFVNQSYNSTNKANEEMYSNIVQQQESNNWKKEYKYGASHRWIVYKAIEMVLNK